MSPSAIQALNTSMAMCVPDRGQEASPLALDTRILRQQRHPVESLEGIKQAALRPFLRRATFRVALPPNPSFV